MKKVFTFSVAVILTASVFAQSPERMSYQAVIRNSSNVLVTNTQIGMQISIIQSSASGTAVYVETQTPTTNDNGLVSIEIGAGTVVSGEFISIEWANGSYFLKTETDPAGGTNYTITGTSQLLSVPYALHAKTAETVTGNITETDPIFGSSVAAGITETDTTNWNNKLDSYTETDPIYTSSVAAGILGTDTTYWNNKLDNYTETDPVFGSSVAAGILETDTAYWNNKQDQLMAGSNISIIGNTISATGGDFYLGQDTLDGIVFYIYLGSDNQQHGLIVSKTASTAMWQSTPSTTNATRSWDGAYNTNLMINSPAKDWVTGLGADWYLPSFDEFNLLWQNRFHANKGLNDAGATLFSDLVIYWTSTELEQNANYAYCFPLYYGFTYFPTKTTTYSVRAVRAF